MRRSLTPKILTLLVLCGAATAPVYADRIYQRGSKEPLKNVTIDKATWEQVMYKLPGVARAQPIDADDIERIDWESESSSVSKARRNIEAGEFAKAVASLSAAKGLPGRSGANAGYLLGLANLMWGARNESKYNDALKAFDDFIEKHEKDKEFYVPHAYIGYAEAATALRQYAQAEAKYKVLADGKMGKSYRRAGQLGQAKVLVAQEKYSNARRIFNDVRNDGDAPDEVRAAAHLGYARCQLGEKQYKEAADTVKERLLQPNGSHAPRYGRILGRAWIVLGDAEAESGGGKDQQEWALIRYLMAINTQGVETEELAEAYYKAREMYKKLGRSDKAADMDSRLKKDWPNSCFAKM